MRRANVFRLQNKFEPSSRRSPGCNRPRVPECRYLQHKTSINNEVWRRDEPSQEEISSDNDNGIRLRSTELPRKKLEEQYPSSILASLFLSRNSSRILQRSFGLRSEQSKAGRHSSLMLGHVGTCNTLRRETFCSWQRRLLHCRSSCSGKTFTRPRRKREERTPQLTPLAGCVERGRR